MDARPTIEQRELADAADRLGTKLGPATVGDLDDHERRARLDAALSQAGWRELRSGSLDGPAASGVEAALVVRNLARRACDVALVGPLLAGDLLRLADVVPDDVVRTVAMRPDLRNLARLGESAVAIDAARATSALALDGADLISVDLGTTSPDGIDLTRPAAVITAVAGTALGNPIGDDALRSWTALGVTLTTADLVGAMEGAIELSAGYAKDRRQYGAPIGSYQAVQHLLAEAHTLTEGASSAMYHAAWAVDALPGDEALDAAAVAKAYAARAARTVCETAIQVHGGIGNTWECMAHVFLRRVLLSTELFGDDAVQLARLSTRRWGGPHGLS